MTNISHTHLEGLGDIKGVADAKAEFIENMDENGTLITNADDDWCTQISRRFCGKSVGYGFSENALIKASKVDRNSFGFDFTVNNCFSVTLNMLGRHNICNALAAIALCYAIGLRLEDVCGRFGDFKPPPMRMEKQIYGDIVVINDEYNSSPLSMSAALEELTHLAVPGRRVLVCGDMLELGSRSVELHKEIGEQVANSNIDILCTVGPYSKFVAEEAMSNGMPMENIHSCKNSEEMRSLVNSLLKSSDTVLIKGSRKMNLESVSHEIEQFSQKNK